MQFHSFSKVVLVALLSLVFMANKCEKEHLPDDVVITDSPINMVFEGDYSDMWRKVDSLERNGLYRSALDLVDVIDKQAVIDENYPEVVKALIHKVKFNTYFTEDEQVVAIYNIEQRIATSEAPLKQILHSVVAKLYWEYYNTNQWKFMNRTRTENFEQADLRTWDLYKIAEEVRNHFLASLSEPSLLQRIQIDEFKLIIENPEQKGIIRPTLYDFLAHEALNFFETASFQLPTPIDVFSADDPRYFGSTSEFAQLNFETPDSLSTTFYAFTIHRDLAKFHANDKSHDALIQLAIRRLDFVRRQSTVEEKESLYFAALNKLTETYPSHSNTSEVFYKMAMFLNQRGDQSSKEDETYRFEKKRAFELCKQTIERFPESIGANLCKSLQNEILRKAVSFKTDYAVGPEQANKLQIQYTNIDSLYFRVIPISWDYFIVSRYYHEELMEKLVKLKSEKSWSVKLKDFEDYQAHSALTVLPEMPKGHYLILASPDKNFAIKTNAIAHTTYWSTELTLLKRQEDENSMRYTVLNRITGEPIKGAQIQIYDRDYDYTAREYKLKKSEKLTTNIDGAAVLPASKSYRNVYVHVSHDKDEYADGTQHYLYNNRPYKEETTYTTNLFTDRKMYRPGQKIFFKGILMEHTGDKHEIQTNKSGKVTFYDVNNQKVADMDYTTNEFGSFSGSFDAPQGLINGTMRIMDANRGSVSFSVEEYKRPKFEVKMLPMEGAYKLGQTISVKGEAKNYAGSVVDGAKVSYRVTRSVRYPYWGRYYRGYYPQIPDMEIANGTIETDEKGAFEVRFDSKEDKKANSKFYPVYHYSVSVDVTDITGETQSTSQSVAVAKHAMNLEFRIANKVDRTGQNDFPLSSTNLNGRKLNAKGTITVHRLEEPSKLYKPAQQYDADYSMLTEDELRQKFPFDDFNDERQVENLKKGTQVFKDVFNTAVRDSVRLNKMNTWKTGRYVLEVISIDTFGVEVKDVKYFTLYDFNELHPPTKEFWWITAKKSSYEPGEIAEFLISSACENMQVLVEVEGKNGIIHKERMVLSNTQQRIQIPVKEEHRGNFSARFTAVKEGVFFSEQFTVSIPYSNKVLDVSFETFRNKLLPGQKEEWKVKIKGPKGEKVAAEMLAAMYDASLDQFMANSFYMSIYGYYYPKANWTVDGFGMKSASLYQDNWNPYFYAQQRIFPTLKWFGYYFDGYYRYYNAAYSFDMEEMSSDEIQQKPRSVAANQSMSKKDKNELAAGKSGEVAFSSPRADATTISTEREIGEAEGDRLGGIESRNAQQPQIRTNLNETAFFYPHLKTNSAGEIIISFTIPEALTRWKFISISHTKDLKTGYLTEEIVTQKDLMVMPNPPRFMREGDKMTFMAKVSNLSDKDLNGTAKLEFFDALTMAPLNDKFNLTNNILTYSVKKAQSTPLAWEIEVPFGVNAVLYRVTAVAGNFSDGEESALPILTNRMLVTESLPLPSKGIGTKVFKLEKLLNSGSSSSLKHHQLTLEYTSNPAWYAVQAMPYMMEYPYECAEQIFTRYYANSLATTVMNSNPKIKAVFDEWKTSSPDAFLSNLEKNQELKSLLVEETPWVVNAQNESERKKRAGLLFDLNKMSGELQSALRKLEKMQVSNGGWPWFPGMPENRYITQHIVTGMGHLDRLGVKDVRGDNKAWKMVKKAIDYLDTRLIEDLAWLKKHYPKTYLNEQHISQTQIQYFYARSFFTDLPINSKLKEAHDYYLGQMAKYWLKFGINSQAMIALAGHRYEMKTLPGKVMASLKERSITHEELGMYWKDNVVGYYWYQAPIETQALLIEAFDEVANDMDAVEEMKVWLLKQKQTTDWKTTRATSEAVYALLMRGTDLLTNEEIVEIEVAGKRVDPSATGQKVEAGTGYFKKTWSGSEVKTEMGEVKVTRKTKGVSWGALYWQYFEDLDKITPHETPLKLEKKLFLVKLTPSGESMTPITAQTKLKAGDKIRVRVELRTDRDMEYVHMKDMRAAGFEPVNVFSRYKYQGGIGYYESTKDASTNFFMDYLRKGTYVFEYDLRANLSGDFSNGITTIQCMYAPEFTSHSEGIRVKIE